jgi:hypothetical protein
MTNLWLLTEVEYLNTTPYGWDTGEQVNIPVRVFEAWQNVLKWVIYEKSPHTQMFDLDNNAVLFKAPQWKMNTILYYYYIATPIVAGEEIDIPEINIEQFRKEYDGQPT